MGEKEHKSLRSWKGDFQEQWEVPIDVVSKERPNQTSLVEKVSYTPTQTEILTSNESWTCGMYQLSRDHPYVVRGRPEAHNAVELKIPGGFVESVFKKLRSLGYNPECTLVGYGQVGDEYSGIRLEDKIDVPGSDPKSPEKTNINLRIFQYYFNDKIVEASAYLEFFEGDNKQLTQKVRDALVASGFERKNVVKGD